MGVLTEQILLRHRETLIQRSPVFKDILTHPFFGITGMTLEETDEELGIFLEFLSSNTMTPDTLLTIYKLAMKYKVKVGLQLSRLELESMCSFSCNLPILYELANGVDDAAEAGAILAILTNIIQGQPLKLLQGQGILEVSGLTLGDIILVIQGIPPSQKSFDEEISKTIDMWGKAHTNRVGSGGSMNQIQPVNNNGSGDNWGQEYYPMIKLIRPNPQKITIYLRNIIYNNTECANRKKQYNDVPSNCLVGDFKRIVQWKEKLSHVPTLVLDWRCLMDDGKTLDDVGVTGESIIDLGGTANDEFMYY